MTQPRQTMDCQTVAESLPWLINGSLEDPDRQALLAHLAVCASCSAELVATAEAWQLLGEHVPSLTLARYAQGLRPSGLDRERIERHLALCPSCRDELAMARPDSVVDFPTDRVRRAAPFVRRIVASHRLAVAAGLAALLSTSLLLWNFASNRSAGQTETKPPVAALPGGGEDQAGSGPVTDPNAELFGDGFEHSTDSWSLVEPARTEQGSGSEGARDAVPSRDV